MKPTRQSHDSSHAVAVQPPAFDLAVRIDTSASGNRIVFRRTAARDTTLGAEGYRLDVRPGAVTITASAPTGAFYATQTIRQLLPAAVYRSAKVADAAWRIPAVKIEDRPRFRWRGAHLDVARHFMPKEFVKKYIDLLALHKINMLPLASHRRPGLAHRDQEVSAAHRGRRVARRRRSSASRSAIRPRNVFDNKRHGGFYTQDDVREIVAYARDRFVTVVPEIEMPGHAQAAIAAYPELGNLGDTIKPWTMWGVSPYILNPRTRPIAFMQDVLTEVMALFPGPFIHVGGDEAIKPQWKASPRAQARIKELGLKDENELQSWFIKQMDSFLTAHGRRLVGWDEILEGGLAPNAVVMSWRGTAGGIAAARAGHDVVMAPGSHTYFDHYQSAKHDSEPLAIGGFLPIDTVYAYEPVPAELEPQFATHILGAQASAVDGVHRGAEERRVHGVPAIARAGRSAVDAARASRLRRFQQATFSSLGAARRARRQLSSVITNGDRAMTRTMFDSASVITLLGIIKIDRRFGCVWLP